MRQNTAAAPIIALCVLSACSSTPTSTEPAFFDTLRKASTGAEYLAADDAITQYRRDRAAMGDDDSAVQPNALPPGNASYLGVANLYLFEFTNGQRARADVLARSSLEVDFDTGAISGVIQDFVASPEQDQITLTGPVTGRLDMQGNINGGLGAQSQFAGQTTGTINWPTNTGTTPAGSYVVDQGFIGVAIFPDAGRMFLRTDSSTPPRTAVPFAINQDFVRIPD